MFLTETEFAANTHLIFENSLEARKWQWVEKKTETTTYIK